MPSRAHTKRARSYAWALHLEASAVDPEALSEEAQLGLEYARELAEDALERSRDPRRWRQLEPLTPEQLAYEEAVPTVTIERLITLARRSLFGRISDAAIAKRVQRQRGRTDRTCAESLCRAKLAITAPANQQYCNAHRTSAARTARHRRLRAR